MRRSRGSRSYKPEPGSRDVAGVSAEEVLMRNSYLEPRMRTGRARKEGQPGQGPRIATASQVGGRGPGQVKETKSSGQRGGREARRILLWKQRERSFHREGRGQHGQQFQRV